MFLKWTFWMICLVFFSPPNPMKLSIELWMMVDDYLWFWGCMICLFFFLMVLFFHFRGLWWFCFWQPEAEVLFLGGGCGVWWLFFWGLWLCWFCWGLWGSWRNEDLDVGIWIQIHAFPSFQYSRLFDSDTSIVVGGSLIFSGSPQPSNSHPLLVNFSEFYFS